MLRFKPDVIIGSPTSELIQAIHIVAICYNTYDCWVTSLADGIHRGKPVDASGKDPHYVGKAADFRLKNIPQNERESLIFKIKTELGPKYYIEWESQNTDNEHLHVQCGYAI